MNLNDFIMANEVPVRLGFFFGIFAVMALWEILSPRRALQASKTVRWSSNLRLVFPAAAVGMTKWLEAGLPVVRQRRRSARGS